MTNEELLEEIKKLIEENKKYEPYPCPCPQPNPYPYPYPYQPWYPTYPYSPTGSPVYICGGTSIDHETK